MIRPVPEATIDPGCMLAPRGAAADRGQRLAVVLPEFAGGGAQRDVVLLCNALARKGRAVTILVLRDEGPLRELLSPGVAVQRIPGGRVRYAIPGLRRAFRTLAPRLVLSSESNLNLGCLAAAATLARANRPKIVLREVGSPSAAQRHDPYWQNRVAYRVLRRYYRYADRVITLTEGARQDLIEHFSIPATTVAAMTSNAVIPPETAERLARWDGEQGREANLIVAIGRLSPEKGHRLLLQAVARLDPARPWRLVLVGEGSERPALEAAIAAAGLSPRVTLTGFAPDPFAWLMRASVAVCSSVYEGLCNAIIEALACGTPVVSTDCPYGPREILQRGRYGTLVPPGDADRMAAAIEQTLDTPADRQRLRARAFDYTAQRAADNFLQVVADL